MRVWILSAVLALGLAAGCGDDDGSGVPDAAVPDARLGADANENLIDTGISTTCGDLPDQMQCDRAFEICVLTDTGGSLQPSCEGCDQDARNCASCGLVCGELTCGDTGEDNTIECF